MNILHRSHRMPRRSAFRGIPSVTRLLAGLLLLGAATGQASTALSREERIQRYVQYCAAVRERVIDGCTCPHNPAQVATFLATDPAGLASWVREKIAYDPSFGSNRGADGTLAAMAGGDWDRALLLGEMLRAGGYSPRYLAVPRTPAEIAAVQAAWLKRECHWRKLAADTAPAADAPRPAADLLAEHGIDLASVRNHQARAAQLWTTQLREAGAPVEAVATKIESAAGKLADAKAGAAAATARLQQALQTRVLVEIDLDGTPLVLSPGPDAAPPVTAVSDDLERLEEVPEDQRTQFILTVQMEPAAADGAAEPITLFTWAKDLSALGLNPARLEIVPVNIAYDDPAFTWAPAIWRERLSKLEQFQVVLRHGDSPLAGPVFTRDGTLLGSGGGKAGDAGKLGQGVGDMFGGAFGGEEEEEPESAPATPAASAALPPMTPTTSATVHPLCLILEIREPGQPVVCQKRLLTGALRPGKLPIYTADILACGGALGPLSVAWLALDATTANAATLGDVLTSADPKRFEGHDELKRFPGLLHDWQLGRLALAARQLRDHPELTLQTGPTVVLVSNQLCPDERSSEITARVALDVAFDGLALVPRTEQGFPAAYAANVRLGIASTLLETALLRRQLPPPAPRGTYELWQLAEKAGKAPLAVLATESGDLGRARPHPLAVWGIRGGETGKLLVFPGGAEPRVWWSINPLDGRTIGRGEGAEGLSMMEYLQVIKLNLSNLKCNMAVMQALLGGGSPDKTGQDWLKCMTGADNPGSYVNWAGSVLEVYQVVQWGGTLAQIGDCLAGAWDVYEMVKGD